MDSEKLCCSRFHNAATPHSLSSLPTHVLHWDRNCFPAILSRMWDWIWMWHTWFAGPEACQCLGILHWDPADGETTTEWATHVYQVLFCPLLPGWQCISGRSLQLWNITGKCIHIDDVDMNLKFFILCLAHTLYTWSFHWSGRLGQSSWLEISLIVCTQLMIPLSIVSRMLSISIKTPLRKWCLKL